MIKNLFYIVNLKNLSKNNSNNNLLNIAKKLNIPKKILFKNITDKNLFNY